MSDSDPFSIMDRAADGIAEEESFGIWFRNRGIGTILLTFVVAISDGILTGFATVSAVFSAVAGGLSDLIGGTFGTSVDVISAGGQAAADSFLTGWAQFFGPFAFPAAIAVVMLGLFIFSRAWDDFVGFNPLDFIRNVRD